MRLSKCRQPPDNYMTDQPAAEAEKDFRDPGTIYPSTQVLVFQEMLLIPQQRLQFP